MRPRPYERALFGRQLVVTLLPAACYLLRDRADSIRTLLGLTLAATILNFIYYVLLIRGLFPTVCRWARLVLDICLWTLFMYQTGGPASLFYLGYVAEILLSAVAVSPAGCLVAGGLSGAGFAVLLAVHPSPLTWEQVLARLLGLLLVAVIGWMIVRGLVSRAGRIESLNRDLMLRAERISNEAAELRNRLLRAQAQQPGSAGLAETLHEIRNTVHGLGGLLGLLKEDLAQDARCAARVALIESGVQNMRRMAEEMLSQSTDVARSQTRLEVGEVLREAAAFATQGKVPAGIALHVHEEGSLNPIRANRETLRRAFVNLIQNALQAMPSGGRLDIRCRAAGPGWIQVEFADTGSGVPAAIQDRLFEPFVTGRADGIGLGLAISRRVVESCGGTLALARSGAAGTTMTIRLPAVASTAAGDDAAASFDEPLAQTASSS